MPTDLDHAAERTARADMLLELLAKASMRIRCDSKSGSCPNQPKPQSLTRIRSARGGVESDTEDLNSDGR